MELNLPGTLTEVIAIEDASQVGQVRRRALQIAAAIGFDATDAGRAALVVTELASNILKHARLGEMHLRVVPGGAGLGLDRLGRKHGHRAGPGLAQPGGDLSDLLPGGRHLEAGGDVVPKADLMARVWPDTAVSIRMGMSFVPASPRN